LSIDGQGGTDEVRVNAALSLGSATRRTVYAAAETIRLNANVQTDTAATAGSAIFTGAVLVGGNVTIGADATTTDAALAITGPATDRRRFHADAAFGGGADHGERAAGRRGRKPIARDARHDGGGCGWRHGGHADIGVLTVQNSAACSFQALVDVATLTIAATTAGGNVRFQQNATIGSLGVAAGSYNLAFLERKPSSLPPVSFANTGTVTLGDDASDSTRFAGGVTTTAATGGTPIAGAVATTGAGDEPGSGHDGGGRQLEYGRRRRSRSRALQGGNRDLTLSSGIGVGDDDLHGRSGGARRRRADRRLTVASGVTGLVRLRARSRASRGLCRAGVPATSASTWM
jgi:hypothetical protein